jgi:hypothetical protein
MTFSMFAMKVEDYGTSPDVVLVPAGLWAKVEVPCEWTVVLRITKDGRCIFDEVLTVEDAQAIRDKLTENINEALRKPGSRGN